MSLKVLVKCDEPCSYEVPCYYFFKCATMHVAVAVWRKTFSFRDVTL